MYVKAMLVFHASIYRYHIFMYRPHMFMCIYVHDYRRTTAYKITRLAISYEHAVDFFDCSMSAFMKHGLEPSCVLPALPFSASGFAQ